MDRISDMACPHAHVERQHNFVVYKFSEKFLCVEEAIPCMGVKLCSIYGCQQIDFTVSFSCYNEQQSIRLRWMTSV